MQLPLTSLVPTIVEITAFIQTNWPHIWWFPNWYLGLPLKFVTGPIVPGLTLLIQKLTTLSIEQSYLSLLFISWILGAVGLVLFTRSLGAGKWQSRMSALLWLLLPMHVWLLAFGSGLHHISISLLPWILYIAHRALVKNSYAWFAVTALLIAIVGLIDVGVLLAVFVGLLILMLTKPVSRWVELLVSLTLVFAAALSLASIWYGLRFWLVLLSNPSFGGRPLSNVIPFIMQLGQAITPILAAIWFVRKRHKKLLKVHQFALLFGISFGFLTVIRMLSDIDFWMDWTGYGLELQLAAALGLPTVLTRLGSKKKLAAILSCVLVVCLDGFLVKSIYGQTKKVINYQHSIISLFNTAEVDGQAQASLSNVTELQQPRFFLSGSPVFWLGSYIHQPNSELREQNFLDPQFTRVETQPSGKGEDPRSDAIGENPVRTNPVYNIFKPQVRGGRDEVATHKTWAMGSYQIREGEDVQLLKAWLSIFGASYILVHGQGSQEYFHDYKNTGRFDEFKLLQQEKDDRLYSFPGAVVRQASQDLLDIPKPSAGNDRQAVLAYRSLLGEAMFFTSISAQKLQIQIPPTFQRDRELISLALSFDPGWQVIGDEVQLERDAFGNMVIIPGEKTTQAQLVYRDSLSWVAVILSIISFVLLRFRYQLSHLFERQLTIGLTNSSLDEQENY